MPLLTPSRNPIGIALVLIAALSIFRLAIGANDPANPRVVHIVAQRFAYTPDEIILKTNEPVALEFTSLDFTHGFKIPDLNIRADLPPGKTTVVKLTPTKAGEYDFFCDNFCGDEHELMSAKIIVKD